MYNKFKTKKKQTPPSAQNKMKTKYPQLVVDRKKINSLPFTVTVEKKIRELTISYTPMISCSVLVSVSGTFQAQ